MGVISGTENENHESYGLVGINRVSGRFDNLFGTDVPHNAVLNLTIRKCSVDRHLNKDWYCSEGQLIDIYLTHSQFSEMVSNMNCSYGVPCTIKHIDGKTMENPPNKDRRGQFSDEFSRRAKSVSKKLDDLLSFSEDLLGKAGMTKAKKNELVSRIEMAKQEIGANMPFVERQFGKCLVKAEDDAKRNIEGHLMNVVLNAGNRGMVDNTEQKQIIGELNDHHESLDWMKDDPERSKG